jgi:hypothetical protein
VVLDKSQRSEKYSSADFVARAGIPLYINSKHTITHNKIMITERNTRSPGVSISAKRRGSFTDPKMQ